MPAQTETSVSCVKDNVWVFGYGSLIWKPNFKYEKVLPGSIEGVSRKFWQGSRDHRGTDEKPGRVATLVEDPQGKVCGLGFELSPEEAEATFNYLDDRETGYKLKQVIFYPCDPSQSIQKVLVYTATESNPDFLGPSPLTEMADCIATCEGHSGPNSEYLFNLAHMMRLLFPACVDEELFLLEEEVKRIKNGYIKKNEKR
ncbi:putative glutathione-specific gamma-glutamylcyclotransferase 2 [Bolinopsis microptera]|uniref:putative glutathione-specific gamma-glutamylcyclotransferase 2 n=1 Tax=Bolinopsis microptera TaxID=2820187 RepID=UPI0030793429